MNVVFVSTYPPAQCGIGTYTQALSTAIKNLGHNVAIIAEMQPGTRDGSRSGIYWDWHRHTDWRQQILRTIDSSPTKPDVVHFQHEHGLFPRDDMFWALVEDIRARGIRVIVTLHTVVAPPSSVGFFGAIPAGAEVDVPRLMGRSDLDRHASLTIIVHTAAAHACVAAWCVNMTAPPRIVRIPHGLEASNARRRRTGTDVIALCPGFVSPSKGHEEIIEAFAEYKTTTRSTTKLVICGLARDALYYQKLQGKIREFGFDTHSLQFINNYAPDPTFHFDEASYIVLGNGKGSPYSASGQLAMAMSFGLPVIAKRAPIYEDIPGVLYYSTPREAAMFMRALDSADLRRCLGDSLHRFGATRDWRAIAERHVEAYSR